MARKATEHHALIVPSSPNDIIKIKQGLREIVNCKIRVKSEQDAEKDIVNKLVTDFNIPKKIVKKAANAMFKEEYQQMLSENEDLRTFLETIKVVSSSDEQE